MVWRGVWKGPDEVGSRELRGETLFRIGEALSLGPLNSVVPPTCPVRE